MDPEERAAVAKGDYSILETEFDDKFGNSKYPSGGGMIGGASGGFKKGDIVYTPEFDNAVKQVLQSDYIKNYDGLENGNGLRTLAKETGKP